MTSPTTTFAAARKACGMTLVQWGHALGLKGKNLRQHVSALERGGRPISPQVARLAAMYARYGVPEEFQRS